MKVISKLFLFSTLILFAACATKDSKGNKEEDIPIEQIELEILKTAYPGVDFTLSYDENVSDWVLSVTSYGKTTLLYRTGGKYLTEKQRTNPEHYRKVFSIYNRKTLDPETMTEEQIEKIRNFGSTKNRTTGAVASTAIFTAIYDSETRKSTESHLKTISFLDCGSVVHERIVPVLQRIEEKILLAAQTDSEVQSFLDNLESAGSYSWRAIRDNDARSFHSFAIAIDILPDDWEDTIIYWNFEKTGGNEDWMLIPLKDRWMPPAKVIEIFEDEGFIWGGRWAVWDNMHFEYHPEIIGVEKYKKYFE